MRYSLKRLFILITAVVFLIVLAISWSKQSRTSVAFPRTRLTLLAPERQKEVQQSLEAWIIGKGFVEGLPSGVHTFGDKRTTRVEFHLFDADGTKKVVSIMKTFSRRMGNEVLVFQIGHEWKTARVFPGKRAEIWEQYADFRRECFGELESIAESDADISM
jgi:hypothetical protein